MADRKELPDEIQVQIDISCSDAREGGPLFAYAKDLVRNAYSERGVMLDVTRISAAGSFVTPDIWEEIKTTIEMKLRQYGERYRLDYGHSASRHDGVPIRIFINISTHGDARLKQGIGKAYGPNDIEINKEAAYNCGMLGAAEVWNELMDGMIRAGPEFRYHDRTTDSAKTARIDSREAIHEVLMRNYGYCGEPMVFIRSIGALDMHAMEQKEYVRSQIKADKGLMNLPIHITAAVDNYPKYEYHRMDGNRHIWSYRDDVYAVIRDMLPGLPDGSPYVTNKSAKQTPLLALIHPSTLTGIRANVMSDARAAGTVPKTEGAYLAGQVFTVSGRRISQPYCGYDKYQMLGLYYALAHLRIKTIYMVGQTDAETRMMLEKAMNDPFMKFAFSEHRPKIERRTAGQISERDLPKVDGATKAMMDARFGWHTPNSLSVLARPKITRAGGRC
ncbi:MAG: hypothetical protein ACP5NX_01500 [Candidatus Bilamarchaeaceae archaeon]